MPKKKKNNDLISKEKVYDIDSNLVELTENFNKFELAKMWSEGVKTHIELIRWLYDNHKEVLREFEKKHYGNMRVEFLGDKNGVRKESQ